MILTPLQNLPKNVEDLGKLIVANGFKKLPKVKKNCPIWSHCFHSITGHFEIVKLKQFILNVNRGPFYCWDYVIRCSSSNVLARSVKQKFHFRNKIAQFSSSSIKLHHHHDHRQRHPHIIHITPSVTRWQDHCSIFGLYNHDNLATTNIIKIAKVSSKCCQILTSPKIYSQILLKILPKWRNIAKSGNSEFTPNTGHGVDSFPVSRASNDR